MPKVIVTVRSPKHNNGSAIVNVVRKNREVEVIEQSVVIPDGEERSFTVDRGQELRIIEN